MEFPDNKFFDFIEKNKNADPYKLKLTKNLILKEFDLDFAIIQIESRKKSKGKLNNFINNSRFLFPDTISSEQASHQAIAKYHASLCEKNSSILDMSAGLGIDSLSFSQSGLDVTAIELDPIKAQVLDFNAKTLSAGNIKILNTDSIKYLLSSDSSFDIIFIDPSRRDTDNKRVYNLLDCSPNVVINQKLLMSHAEKILIKASPLLDITQTIRDFNNIASIRAVGVKGECKEILIELNKKPTQEIILEAINLDPTGEILNKFTINNKPEEIIYLKDDIYPGDFILEPSPMVMKLAPWSQICSIFNARKFGKSSHLFLSKDKPSSFPGRVTVLEKIIKKHDRKSIQGLPAIVVSKNYPLSADELRKELKIKEGEDNVIYASRINEKPIILLSH